MGSLSVWHWALVLGVMFLLFGARRLPDTARNVGRSMRILKSEVAAMSDDTTSPTPLNTRETATPPDRKAA